MVTSASAGSPEMPPSLALLHHHYGPYHLARARALRRSYPGRLHFVQLAESETLRAWRVDNTDIPLETAAAGVLDQLPPKVVIEGVNRVFDRLRPQVIAVAGYADVGMRQAAAWARREGARTVLLSDSQACDSPRRAWREWAKRQWVSRHFDAAFVSGATAALYAQSLGIPRHLIWRGYDVVDNDHFAGGATASPPEPDLPAHFFLYVGRFSPEKNLPRLLQAFRGVCADPELSSWGLVLVGGGPQEPELRRAAEPMGDRVRFAGFQQLERLPPYYGRAAALVLPSLSEPWGLVVNEAMAAGLPVLVSTQCGCVNELAFPGINAILADPLDVDTIRDGMVSLARNESRRRQYGAASRRIVQNFSLETWAMAMGACAMAVVRPAAGVRDVR
jgi:1,2-diacylglycerol 3-alpha-glucosyltransferase